MFGNLDFGRWSNRQREGDEALFGGNWPRHLDEQNEVEKSAQQDGRGDRGSGMRYNADGALRFVAGTGMVVRSKAVCRQ